MPTADGRAGSPGTTVDRGSAVGLRRALRVPWAFVLLALLPYAAIVLYPSVAGALFAFTDWSGVGSFRWVGLRNFHRVAEDREAYVSLGNTVFLAVTTTVVQNLCGLALALALNGSSPLKAVLRPVFLAPVLLAPVVVGVVWQYVYAPEGALNAVLAAAGLADWQRAWLGEPGTALWVVSLTVVWQYVGITTCIYLAGLQAIAPELQEAAAIDGAGTFARFRRITLPLLAPAVTVNVLLPFIGGLKLFDQIFVMTNGGPGYSTQTVALMIYRQAFTHGAFAYSTALAVVLTVLVAVVALVQLAALRRREAAP